MTSVLYLVASHGAVVLTWAILGLAIAGVGLLYRRGFTRGDLDAQEVLTAFWTGFALMLFFLQVWHLALPISSATLLTLLALGGVGLWSERVALRSWIGRRPWTGHRPAVLLSLALIAWTANRSIGPIELYDTGMYHISVVEWSKAHAIVPGLANLHGRLGFNSASLLYAAMVDQNVWSGRAFHVANTLLLVIFGVQAALGWTRLLSAGRPRPADIFDALLILPVLGLLVSGDISSLETDLPVGLMLLVAASRIHRSLFHPDGSDDARRSHFAASALLLGAAVCVKLSAVVLAGALSVVALWVYWPELKRSRAMVVSILTPAAMGFVWIARGVVLSGFPVYPSTAFGVSVPWRVPTEQAVAEAAWIRMSGHELNHNRIVAGFDWLIPWAKEISTDFRFAVLVPLPAALTLVFGVIAALRWHRRPESSRQGRSVWVLLIPAMIGATFWFFAAPHPRFGMAPIWLGAALTSALWFSTLPDDDAVRRRYVGRLGVALATAFVVCVLSVAVFKVRGGKGEGRLGRGAESIAGLVFLPGPDHGFYPAPNPVLVSYTTTSGLRLAVPRDNNLCWRGPLLCTPHPAPNLRLRNPNDVGDGFVADGGRWLPVRWPNPWTPFLPWLACRSADGALPAGLGRDRACIAQTARTPTDTLERVTTPLTPGDPNRPVRKTPTEPSR